MKILLVAEFFPENNRLNFTGGVETFNFYLSSYLSKSNQVIVLARRQSDDQFFKKPKSWQFDLIRIGNPTKHVEASLWSIPSRLQFIVEGIRQGQKIDFDIIQGNNFTTYLMAFVIGLLKKKPKVAWYPDVFVGRWVSLTNILVGFVGETIERINLVLPWDIFIALSNQTRTRLIEAGVDKKKIKVVYIGINSEIYEKFKAKKVKPFTISCICRLVSYKRADLLIKAVKILSDQGINLKVSIIGSGPEKVSLENLIRDQKLDKKVKIYSNLSINQKNKILKQSSLFCLPSEVEGFGIVILEAASCGLPLLLTDIPIFKEVTRGGVGSLFFRKGDEKDLASKIKKIMLSGSLRNKLSKETKDLVSFYSWEKITKEFERIYLNLIVKNEKI
jgi:glycosyltransferase involved in cell wall biosynthesis